MYNKILTKADRKKYSKLIEEMFTLVPEMMARKIPEANVNQAFIIDMVLNVNREGDKVLCVGSYEDTAYEYLKLKKLDITGICPEQNYSLREYMEIVKGLKTFDTIFATSVLEHIDNDEEFIEDICKLLNPNGIAILTVDFKETYNPNDKRSDKKPDVDYRLYTSKDYKRLSKVLENNGCYFVDEFVANSKPDFSYEGIKYSFSTMVFKRLK
jgi:SAM-dependent methyltransferase